MRRRRVREDPDQDAAGELVDWAVAAGLIERAADADDARFVRVRLTPAGRSRLSALSAAHLQELDRLVPRMAQLWEGLKSGAPAA